MSDKTVNLYLSIRQDSGMKFSPVDPLTNRVNKKVILLIFPEKPTAVDENVAAILLEQNPHLLSKDPYQADNDVRLNTIKTGQQHLKYIEAKRTMETTEERSKANARFVRVAETNSARLRQKVKPSFDKGLMFGGDQNAINDEGEFVNAENPMKYLDVLQEFSETPKEDLNRERIRYFAKTLDLKLGRANTIASLLPLLDERAAKLTLQIKAYIDRQGRVDAANAVKIQEAEAGIPKPSRQTGLLPASALVETPVVTPEVNKSAEAETVLAAAEEPVKKGRSKK